MDLLTAFGILAIAALLAASLSAGEITKVLRKNGVAVDSKDFTWLRLRQIGVHLRRYRQLTLDANGSVGRAYYACIASAAALGALIVAGIVTRLL